MTTDNEQSGVVLYVSISKDHKNIYTIAAHGYLYREEGKIHGTAMARHTYSTSGYVDKKILADEEKEGIHFPKLTPTIIEIMTKEKAPKGERLDFGKVIEAMRTAIPIPDRSSIHLTMITRDAPLEFKTDDNTTIINVKRGETIPAIDIAQSLNEIATSRVKDVLVPTTLLRGAKTFFQEKRTIPDCIFNNKILLHRENEKQFLYTVNSDDVTDLGRTLNNTTYTVVFVKSSENVNLSNLEVYQENFVDKSPVSLTVSLNSQAVYQPRISNLIERYGIHAIKTAGSTILLNTAGDINVALGTVISKVNMSIRGMVILDTIKSRLKLHLLDPSKAKYVEFTDKLDELTNQKKFLRVKLDKTNYKLIVGLDVPPYNNFRRMLKSGARFYLSVIPVDGMDVYMVLIDHPDYACLSSNYFCESNYLVKTET